MKLALLSLGIAGGLVYLSSTGLFTEAVNLIDGQSHQASNISSNISSASTTRPEGPGVGTSQMVAGADSPHAIEIEDGASKSPAAQPSVSTSEGEQIQPATPPPSAAPRAVEEPALSSAQGDQPPSSAPKEPPVSSAETNHQLPTAKPPPSAALNQPEFVRVTSAAKIREGPSATAEVVGLAHPGAEAQVVSHDSDWVQIIDPASKKSGWIQSSSLVSVASSELDQNELDSSDAALEQTEAALETPLKSEPRASKRSKTSLKSKKSHKHHARHRHHRRGLAFRFVLRRMW
jgi:SH3-like domain-containing protein